MFGATRTFRWSDGESTEGYEGVDLGAAGARFFSWSHRQGEGRIERGTQALQELLDAGPLRSPPPAIAAQLRAEAERLLREQSAG